MAVADLLRAGATAAEAAACCGENGEEEKLRSGEGSAAACTRSDAFFHVWPREELAVSVCEREREGGMGGAQSKSGLHNGGVHHGPPPLLKKLEPTILTPSLSYVHGIWSQELLLRVRLNSHPLVVDVTTATTSSSSSSSSSSRLPIKVLALFPRYARSLFPLLVLFREVGGISAISLFFVKT